MGRHRAACASTLSVDRVSKGLRRLERRRSRGRDGDGLPGLGVAALAPGAAAHDELPEPRDGHRLVAREGVADGGEHGRDHAFGADPGHGRLGGDVGDEVVPVHLLFPPELQSDGAKLPELRLSVPSPST